MEEVVVAAPKWRSAVTLFGRTINEVVSFVVFCILDLVDAALCFAFKVADYVIEAEWPPCYCSSSKEVITGSGNIVVSEKGEYSKIVCLTSSKLQMEEVSDTLYDRPSFVSEFSWSTVKRSAATRKLSSVRSRFTINSTIVETMLQRRVVGKPSRPMPRWSDCDCRHCTSWTYRGKKTLFVRAAGTKDKASEDVLFIHGFISSSAFWTETLFPNFSDSAKSKYRFLAVDLLGFGRSPKPSDSLYTLREHLDMIEQSVLEPFGVKSFHIVAHSLGCILALALAVKHPEAVKSLTLLAPPYYPIPKGNQPTQYVMRQLAPRRVWPIITFGASLACWYEHITRAACLVFSRHHHFWKRLTRRLTRNRMRTFLLDGFFCHTHKAVWHTLHNVICGGASKLDMYLDAVNERLRCDVTVFHGKDDELIPVECSYNVQRRIPRATVNVIHNKDHITIVVGRQKSFARDLEHIWGKSTKSTPLI